MNAKARKLSSILVDRGDAFEYVKSGSAFRRLHSGRMVETAEILSVYTDGVGIPHVRFDVIFDKPQRPQYRDGPRILAVKTFFENYRERVS